MAEKDQKKVNPWYVVLKVLVGLVLLSLILSFAISLFMDSGNAGNVAMIKVEGPIMVSSDSPFSEQASSSDIIGFIEDADNNPAINAIIIDVNSPGGSAVASDEIASAIRKANKKTVSVIREVGASGGYWVASAADHVIANRMSVTGSIGVLGSYLEFSGFLDRYNVTYQRLVSGKYKDIGTPLKELTGEERSLIQDVLDEIHEDFILAVSENRNLNPEDVRKIADGMLFTGKRAKDLGLVDELGGIEEAKLYLNRTLNITPLIREYEKEPTFMELLFQAISEQSFSVGQGIGAMLSEKRTGIFV